LLKKKKIKNWKRRKLKKRNWHACSPIKSNSKKSSKW